MGYSAIRMAENGTGLKRDLDRIQQISRLMQFQARMPVSPFMTKDKAYEIAGCDPRASLDLFANV